MWNNSCNSYPCLFPYTNLYQWSISPACSFASINLSHAMARPRRTLTEKRTSAFCLCNFIRDAPETLLTRCAKAKRWICKSPVVQKGNSEQLQKAAMIECFHLAWTNWSVFIPSGNKALELSDETPLDLELGDFWHLHAMLLMTLWLSRKATIQKIS